MPRQMNLGAFLMATGHHVAAWRHPEVPADPLDFATYKRTAQIAEAACFDALFVADSVAAPSDPLASHSARSVYFEPLTLLSALSAVTERIGLIATATTSYNEPYHVARKFASLDHLSAGRAGWNLVTSDAAAGQVIERGELACYVVRLVVAGGGGGDQADALGNGT